MYRIKCADNEHCSKYKAEETWISTINTFSCDLEPANKQLIVTIYIFVIIRTVDKNITQKEQAEFNKYVKVDTVSTFLLQIFRASPVSFY